VPFVAAADGRRHVLAIGGFAGARFDQGVPRLVRHAVELAGKPSPRVCLVGTAMGDDAASVLRGYAWLQAAGAQPSHLQLFPMPNVTDPAGLLLAQDVIFVGGGSVAGLAAVWRVHGLDEVMRRAWEAGIVLAGVSAGALCWFEGGTTDSFGPRLRAFTGGLGCWRAASARTTAPSRPGGRSTRNWSRRARCRPVWPATTGPRRTTWTARWPRS